MASEPPHVLVTYNEVHNIIKRAAEKISEFKPDLIIAIGGGGFFPARVLRTFLRNPDTLAKVPILAVGLSLYESVPGLSADQIGTQVIKTQWIGPEARQTLAGKRILVVDEVDDTRKTLEYAIAELQKDAEEAVRLLPEHEREGSKARFAAFVVHNKLRPKLGLLPPDVPYYAGQEVGSVWLDYPWEATDIEEHDRLAQAQKEVQSV
ncbi:phosphoribosyltransferase-like protein [Russula compacta]|nr:phosphoribosyltransferase-like protein [Russula compacta]